MRLTGDKDMHEFKINCGHLLLALKKIEGKLLAAASNAYFIARIELPALVI
jgi:hypothetical protein